MIQRTARIPPGYLLPTDRRRSPGAGVEKPHTAANPTSSALNPSELVGFRAPKASVREAIGGAVVTERPAIQAPVEK
jgi:hypothetical protein